MLMLSVLMCCAVVCVVFCVFLFIVCCVFVLFCLLGGLWFMFNVLFGVHVCVYGCLFVGV